MTLIMASAYLLVIFLTMGSTVAQNTCLSLDIPLICTCEDLNFEATVRCKSNQTHIFDFNSRFIQNITHLHVVGETSLFTFDQIACVFNCSFSNLKTLDVEGNRRDIEINDTHMTPFNGLEHLRLHNCNIRRISTGTFRALNLLKVFEISGNGFLTFDSIESGLDGLNAPGLEVFNISGNHNDKSMTYMTITKSLFLKLSHTSLKIMDFSWTLFLSLQSSFQRLPHLEVLIFTGTPVVGERNCLLSLLALKNLTTLIWDKWPFIPRGYDSIKALPEPSYRYKKDLDLECGQATHTTNRGCIIPEKNLKIVQSRQLTTEILFLGIQYGFCTEPNNIMSLIISGGKISRQYGPIFGLHQLKIFDVGFPEGVSIKDSFQPYNAFYDFPSVEIELVGGNQLSKLSIDDMANMFSKNTKLQVLDISKNDFTILPIKMFVNSTHLEHLNLSFNKLEILNLDFTHNVNLSVIDLQYNNLRTIDANFISSLNDIAYVLEIFLNNNEFECECSLLEIFKVTRVNTTLYCSSGTERILIETNSTNFDRSKFKCDTMDSTKNYTLTIGLSTGGVILIISCIVLTVILKRRRDKMKKPPEVTIITLAPVAERQNNTPKKFVAFLAYSYTDTNFVFKKIYPRLCRQLANSLPDRDPNSLILVNDRHFLPGSPIGEMIDSAINDSYVTIAIISDSFLDSDWCHFEVMMAQISNVPIIPLYLKECDPNKFRGELKLMFHTKVRLLWPHASLDDDSRKQQKKENKVLDTVCVSVLTYMEKYIAQQQGS